MDEDLEEEQQLLEPLINYHRFATGELNSDRNFNKFVEQTIMKDSSDVDWDEDAFNNIPSYDDDVEFTTNEWCDVKLLKLHYPKAKVEIPEKLFAESNHTSRDLARFILSFKSNNLKIGDNIIAEIVGMFASFLPEGIEFIIL